MSGENYKGSSLEDALSGEMPSVDEVSIDEPVETQQPEAQTQEDNVENVETQNVEEAPITEEPPKAEPQDWTYAAYSDEKQKRQNLQSELEKIKAQNQALQYQMQQQAQQPQPAPDYLVDPDAYTNHVQQAAQAPVLSIVQQQALQIAELKHGADKVQAANEWYSTLPPQMQQSLTVASQNTPDPWGMLVQEHTKATLAQEFSDPSELEAYRAWKASQNAVQTPQQAPVTAQQGNSPANVQLSPSITSAPSVGKRSGPVWTGPKSLSSALGEG